MEALDAELGEIERELRAIARDNGRAQTLRGCPDRFVLGIRVV